MKKIFFVSTVFSFISICIVPNSHAVDVCFANLADSAWQNGEPESVKKALNFDLVGTIKKPINPQPIHRYFLYGEHTFTVTYNYVGKYCANRSINVLTTINSQTETSKYETIADYINRNSPNFLFSENSLRYYSDLKNDFSKKTFTVQNRQLAPNQLGSPEYIQSLLRSTAENFSGQILHPAYAFINFPSRCAFWRTSSKEILYAISAGSYYAERDAIINFTTEGECMAELRFTDYTDGLLPAGIKEKIADLRYLVIKSKTTKTVTCTNGKLTKTVTGTNPKCPTGYKQK
jgi:hypothetical protein